MAEPVEEAVTEMLFISLEDADLSGFLRVRERKNIQALEEAIRDDKSMLEQLTQDHYVNKILERGEFLAARDALEKRLKQNRERVRDDQRHGVLGELMAGEKLTELWPSKSLDWKRSVLSIVIDFVEILPTTPGRVKFDPSLVRPVWRF